MESITVFEVNEEQVERNLSSKEIQYEELAQQGVLAKEHFENLLIMENVLAQKQPPDTNIIGVLARYVAQFCTPIVLEKPKFSSQVQFDEVMQVDNSKDLVYIPRGIQISIAGFKIPAVFIRKYYEKTLEHIEHMSHTDISDSGRYNDYSISTLRYLAQRPNFTHAGQIPLESQVLFESEDHARKILLRIIDYIRYIEQFYSTTFPHVNYDFQYIEQPIMKPMKKIKLTTEKQVSSSDVNLEVTNKLLQAIDGRFGESYNFDILYSLDSNGVLHAYNLGVYLGDSQEFKKEVDYHKMQLAYQQDYNRQVLASFTYQNMLSRKRMISLKKYNIEDLEELTPQQKKVIDLEYKKSQSISEDSKEISKAFYRLGRSFEDAEATRLTEAIGTIEKLLSKQQLEAYDILPGGVCPHVYAKGKVLLENFNKPWAQTKLLEKLIEYSLPSDINGYFCKVCGEKLAETDRAQSLTFSGDKNVSMYVISDTADDPLQSMIWKEAMYIITSNVRFRDPIPLKPLVSSLATGLRSIIAAEETKLYRSKTTAQEIIKDTLNLYAAIYIYAAICALMYHNPGRMIFARDKPSDNKESKVAKLEEKVTKGETDGSQADDEMESEYIKETKKPKKFRIRGQGEISTEQNKKAEATIVKNAIILLILSKETIITRIKTMTIPIIKSIFSAAYKWALMNAKPIHVDRDITRQVEMDPIAMLPLYNYIHYAKKMEFFSGQTKFAPGFNDVYHVIGAHREAAIKQATNGDSMWKNVDVKEFDKKLSKTAGYAQYAHKSFLKELEYVRDGIFKQSVVPVDIRMKEFRESLSDIRDFDKKLLLEMQKLRARPHGEIPLNDNIALLNDFDARKIDLAKHYCDNGQNHSIGSYIYTDSKKQHEVKKSDIINWLEKKTPEIEQFANWVLINERCEKCNKLIRTAESNNKSLRALADMFGKIDDITAFYSYYDTRCPGGNLHEFVGQKCKICGFETAFSKSRDTAYYDKWKKKFDAVQKEKLELAIKSIEDLAALPEKSPVRPKITHTYSLRSTAEWSKITGLPYNTIVNIGLTEGLSVDDLNNAKVNPSKDEYFKKTRALKLKSYILDTLRLYNNLLESDNIMIVEKEIAEIANTHKKSFPGLIQALPKFNNFVRLDEQNSFLPIEQYVNFLQEYLAGIFVSIASIDAKFRPVTQKIIQALTNKILAKETFFSKPIPYFFKLDITSLEESEEEAVSGEDWAGVSSSSSESEFAEENEVEVYENEINNEGFDVENEGDVWEVE